MCACVCIVSKQSINLLTSTLPSSIETCRNRAFQLVSRAYDSISWKDLAAIVGLSVEDAIQGNIILNLLTL